MLEIGSRRATLWRAGPGGPVSEIPDDEWVWHARLDAEASAMVNEIYNGGEVDPDRMQRIIEFYRMELKILLTCTPNSPANRYSSALLLLPTTCCA